MARRRPEFPGPWRAAARRKRLPPAAMLRPALIRLLQEEAFHHRPGAGRHRRYGIPVLGVKGGRLEERFEGEVAKTGVQVAPQRRSAGHRHWQPAPCGHLLVAESLEQLWRVGGRRAARAVQPVQLAAIPYQRKSVRADAVRGRLDDGQRDGRGHRGVDRVAAALQRRQPGLRRQWLAGGHDAARGQHRHPARRIRKVTQ